MTVIDINQEMGFVLLRCLSYGEAAISQEEHDNGIGEVIEHNVQLLRKQVCDRLANRVLEDTAEKVKSQGGQVAKAKPQG